MSSEEGKMKFDMKLTLLNENEIPENLRHGGTIWQPIFSQIPEGKAWVITEEELKKNEINVKVTSAEATIRWYIKNKKLSNFKLRGTRKNGVLTLYLIHHKKKANP